MARQKPPDPKVEALRQSGCLNPRPNRVTDAFFVADDFFDARDLVQIKYEMLRRSRVEKQPIATSAAAFGFSRPSFYQAQAVFECEGLRGLVPERPGPRRAHKLSDEVVDFLEKKLASGVGLRTSDLVELVKERFDRSVHPRSIERALLRREKKRRLPMTPSALR